MSTFARIERRAAASTTGRCGDCDEHVMQCMEVWGGNHASHSAVAMPGLEVWVYSEPHEGGEAGGDVHYVSSCGTGRITRILLADVSGHGESAASVAEALRDLMRKYVNYIDQTRFVQAMNREFAELASDDGRFATAVAATFWGPTGRLAVSNAGHPRPYVYKANEGSWRALRSEAKNGAALANLPLGVESGMAYEEVSLHLEAGDLVVLVSDALIEARCADGRSLGEEGLLRLIEDAPAGDPDRLIHEVLNSARAHADVDSLPDDVTILAVRCTGEETHRSPARSLPRAVRAFGQSALESIRRGKNLIPTPEWSLANIGGPFFERLNRRVGSGDEPENGKGG